MGLNGSVLVSPFPENAWYLETPFHGRAIQIPQDERLKFMARARKMLELLRLCEGEVESWTHRICTAYVEGNPRLVASLYRQFSEQWQWAFVFRDETYSAICLKQQESLELWIEAISPGISLIILK